MTAKDCAVYYFVREDILLELQQHKFITILTIAYNYTFMYACICCDRWYSCICSSHNDPTVMHPTVY